MILYATQQLQKLNLTIITDLSILAKLLPGVTQDILNKIPDCQKISVIVNLMNASITYSIKINSYQVNKICFYFFFQTFLLKLIHKKEVINT